MNNTFNPAINEALDLMENTSQNLFITGKAGTGKSTLLTYYRHHTKKKIVVLAPTCIFRSKSNSDSDLIRTVIPIQFEQ